MPGVQNVAHSETEGTDHSARAGICVAATHRPGMVLDCSSEIPLFPTPVLCLQAPGREEEETTGGIGAVPGCGWGAACERCSAWGTMGCVGLSMLHPVGAGTQLPALLVLGAVAGTAKSHLVPLPHGLGAAANRVVVAARNDLQDGAELGGVLLAQPIKPCLVRRCIWGCNPRLSLWQAGRF